MARDRHQGRILAMQALCQWEVHHEATVEALEDFLESREPLSGTTNYAAKIVQMFWDQKEQTDERIVGAAENWDISRMSPVERNIMRVAIVELLTDQVPPKVAINEAIDIGREFGGKDTPGFINGILDAVLKRSKEPAKDDD